MQVFLSVSSATDIFYIERKCLKSTYAAYKTLGSILDIVKVLIVTNDDVLNAFMQKTSDFEDCPLVTCAKSNKCAAIVTRNKKDFQGEEMKDEMRAAYLKLRHDWGSVKPYTRIERNRKKYSRKQKHKKTEEEKY